MGGGDAHLALVSDEPDPLVVWSRLVAKSRLGIST
jgi:hypothetical protein